MTSSNSQSSSSNKLSKKEIRRRLYEQVRREAPALAFGSVAMLCSSLSNQALPRLLGKVLDQDRNNHSRSLGSSSTSYNNSQLTYSLGLVVLGGGLASFLRTTLLNRTKDEMAGRLRQEAFASLLTDKDLEWFQAGTSAAEVTKEDTAKRTDEEGEGSKIPPSTTQGISPAAIGTILSTDIDTMASAFTTSIANLLRSTSSILFGTYHMLTLNPTLFAASFTIIPLVGAAAMKLRARSRKLAIQAQTVATDRADFVQERLDHMMMIKLCHTEESELTEYAHRNALASAVSRQVALQQGIFMGTLFMASASALLLVVQLGAKSVAQGRMTHGQLTSFATYSFLLGLGTSGVVAAMNEMTQGMVAAERYYQLLWDGPTSKDGHDDVCKASLKDNGSDIDVADVTSMALDHVCFSYRSTGKQVLSNVSLQLQRGKVVALVGSNGSGKSSAVAILAGLYSPNEGRVLINGETDLSSLSKAARKKLIQVVPQSTALFNMSILDNVKYSDPNALEENVRKALTLANCDDFVSKLPGEIHFIVGLNGNKLSGGERQRLALARALLSDPAVLLLDEAASSMDSSGEAAVTQALQSCQQGADGKKRCILLVTHQPKSLLLADDIIVMKDGIIVEQGSLDKLNNPSSQLCHLMPDLLNLVI
jgi:ABC-type multidrug transport system fused ATPase/permease subunit